jgi:hypothetical protein
MARWMRLSADGMFCIYARSAGNIRVGQDASRDWLLSCRQEQPRPASTAVCSGEDGSEERVSRADGRMGRSLSRSSIWDASGGVVPREGNLPQPRPKAGKIQGCAPSNMAGTSLVRRDPGEAAPRDEPQHQEKHEVWLRCYVCESTAQRCIDAPPLARSNHYRRTSPWPLAARRNGRDFAFCPSFSCSRTCRSPPASAACRNSRLVLSVVTYLLHNKHGVVNECQQ